MLLDFWPLHWKQFKKKLNIAGVLDEERSQNAGNIHLILCMHILSHRQVMDWSCNYFADKVSTWEEQDKNISRAPVSALHFYLHSAAFWQHLLPNTQSLYRCKMEEKCFMYKNTVWFAVCMFSTSIELLFIWLIKTKARCRMNPSMESTATQISFRRRVEHAYFFRLLMFPCLHLEILTWHLSV